ncbi:MAG: RNA polymerase sigma factor [Spirochaetia bacterium]
MRNDEDLFRSMTEREADAFENLYKRYKNNLFRTIMKIVRNEETARDLCSEVFIKIWLQCGQWGGAGTPAAWMRRIAVNCALDWMKSRQYKNEEISSLKSVDDFAVFMDSEKYDPHYIMARKSTHTEVRKAVLSLPKKKREVVSILLKEGLTMRKLSERLAIPEGTVKFRIYSAKKDLKEQLQESVF